MSGNTSLDLLSLDVDLYKQSLINFLSSQSQFKSYDFAGTNIDVLLSLLGRNTFEYAFYCNMLNSESWLDSNQLRASAVSRSKELSYLPGSATSSSVNISLNFQTNGLNVVLFPKGTPFVGRSGINTLTFTTDQNLVYTSSNGYFQIDNMTIYEGVYVQDNFIMDYTQPTQRFILSNPNIDITSIAISVIEDSGSTTYEYQQFLSLLDVTPTTLAYFLQATDKSNYEIEFGDGVLGRQPKNGALIQAVYRITQGSNGNGVQEFFLTNDVTNGNLVGNVNIIATIPSTGGSEEETIDSIQYYAPRLYQVQERAVSDGDYELLLQRQFPEIRAISTIGGQTLVPPQYGKVFITVDINGISGLPKSKQDAYYNFIKPRCPMVPVFQSANYIYYDINSTVNYNSNITTLKPADIESLAISKLIAYNNANYNDFKVTLRVSPIGTLLDNVHPSIISNETDILLYMKVAPLFGAPYSTTLNFGFPIYNNYPVVSGSHPQNYTHAVYSDIFIYNGSNVFLEDDGNGNLRMVQTVNTTDVPIMNVGSVDYVNGIIQITKLVVTSIQNNQTFNVYVKSATNDVPITGNNLLTLEVSGLNINAVQVDE